VLRSPHHKYLQRAQTPSSQIFTKCSDPLITKC
jgi:hypothetical protein